jgi:hypothetical protein
LVIATRQRYTPAPSSAATRYVMLRPRIRSIRLMKSPPSSAGWLRPPIDSSAGAHSLEYAAFQGR